MLPLRFPNSGIRAKATRKRGGELWSRPPTGAATHKGSRLQCGARKGGRLQHGYLQHYARRSGDLQRDAHLQRRSPMGTAPMGGPADQVVVQGDAISP
ncbi:hypothetical protein GW17_00044294 [Ensete ventricosum]|nr:hypothetical protein GW17_00044294 [Ensete ventricosum]